MPLFPHRAAADLYRRLQQEAITSHRHTGVPHCIVQREDTALPDIVPEPAVIAGGPAVINRILWSTDTADTDGLDPALLA